MGLLTFQIALLLVVFWPIYFLSFQLANTEEYVDGALAGHLGEVLVRYVVHLLIFIPKLDQSNFYFFTSWSTEN